MAMSQPMSVKTSCQETSWFTPPACIEMVRRVLGEIDLDPASAEIPQQWIKANRYWTEHALAFPWKSKGGLFCNPPFGKDEKGRSRQMLWSRKMMEEFVNGNFDNGILLVNSALGYNWYERIYRLYPVCLVEERICFVKPDGTSKDPAKVGQSFLLMWRDPAVCQRFIEEFQRIGRILLPD